MQHSHNYFESSCEIRKLPLHSCVVNGRRVLKLNVNATQMRNYQAIKRLSLIDSAGTSRDLKNNYVMHKR